MGTRKYSEEHEWIDVEGDIGTVGVTDFAQSQLGDVVFVELPEVGAQVEQGGDSGVVESVKAASELYSPVTGEIVEVNEELEGNPGLVNEDPEGEAWFFKIKLAEPSELDDLMDEDDYKKFAKED